MRQLISGLLFSCVLFSSEFHDCQLAKADVITAPLGGTVTLTWKRPARPQPYTVRNTEWKEDIFYISKSGGVRVLHPAYKDRTRNISSSKEGVSVVLHGVKWTHSGRYKCFRGPPERRPRDSINQCGLRLVVIDARDPYVATTDAYDLFHNNGRNLSCIFVTNATSSYPGDTSFIWRRNGAEIDSSMELDTSVQHGETGSQMRVVTSTLAVTSVGDTGDRFTCQAQFGKEHLTGQSEEFALNMDSWPDVYTNHVVLSEGGKATLTWTLPQPMSPFVVTSPSGAAILDVDSASIFITSPYRSRVTVAGVLTADDYMAVQLIVHSVRGNDAGQYSCETRDNGTLADWDNFVYVSRKPRDPTILNVPERQGMVLSCSSASRSLPHNSPEMLSYNWRRDSSEVGLEVFQSQEPTFSIRTSPRDGDHYSCQATEQGLVSQWSDPFVLKKPLVPTISSAGSHLQVMLTCVSASRMFPDAEGDELVYRLERSDSSLEGGEMIAGATLNISSANQGDQYRCQAVEQGLYSDWSDAHVLYEPTIKRLTHNVTSSTDLNPDDVVTFTCEVDGTPPLYVSLIRLSKEGNTALGSTTTYASTTVAFNIGNPSLGEYLCSASNVVGHDDGSASPGFLKSKLRRQNAGDITLRIYVDDAVGTFYLSGYPEPSRTRLSFSPGGLTDIHISNTEKYQLTTSNIEDNWFVVTFTIHNVEASDEGTYTIYVDNGEGSLDVNVELSFSEGEKVVIIAAASVLFVGLTIISIVFLAIRKLTGGNMNESRKRRFNVSGLPDVIREPGSIVTIACRDLHDKDKLKARLPPDIGSDAKRMSFFLHRMYVGNDADDEAQQSDFIASREGDELLLF